MYDSLKFAWRVQGLLCNTYCSNAIIIPTAPESSDVVRAFFADWADVRREEEASLKITDLDIRLKWRGLLARLFVWGESCSAS